MSQAGKVGTKIRSGEGLERLGGNDFPAHPTNHPFQNTHTCEYMEGKRIDDGLPSHLWRIHDKLYDLEGFDHPGGKHWISLTKGTGVSF